MRINNAAACDPIDMLTLVHACDFNCSLRFLWGSEFEINSKLKIDRSVKAL